MPPILTAPSPSGVSCQVLAQQHGWKLLAALYAAAEPPASVGLGLGGDAAAASLHACRLDLSLPPPPRPPNSHPRACMLTPWFVTRRQREALRAWLRTALWDSAALSLSRGPPPPISSNAHATAPNLGVHAHRAVLALLQASTAISRIRTSHVLVAAMRGLNVTRGVKCQVSPLLCPLCIIHRRGSHRSRPWPSHSCRRRLCRRCARTT